MISESTNRGHLIFQHTLKWNNQHFKMIYSIQLLEFRNWEEESLRI